MLAKQCICLDCFYKYDIYKDGLIDEEDKEDYYIHSECNKLKGIIINDSIKECEYYKPDSVYNSG
jgi:hypothetical protein